MRRIDFTGQAAIVTGAGTGIGRHIALLFAQRGANVVVNDYGGDSLGHAGSAERAEAVVREITEAGGRAIASATSVGTPEASLSIKTAALDAFGRIDILVNNAGVTLPGPIADTAQEDIERIVQVNYWGTYNLIRAVWPVMQAQRYGRIVNFTSNAVLGGYGNFAPYASSKGGVLGLTGDAGTEGEPFGIRVNAVVPLAFTRLAGDDVTAPEAEFARWLQRYFQADKVAPVVAYLASREAAVSGEIFSAGGGRMSRIAFVNTDGYFSPDLTPELIAEHINDVRDTGKSSVIASGMDEMSRYMAYRPFTSNKTEN